MGEKKNKAKIKRVPPAPIFFYLCLCVCVFWAICVCRSSSSCRSIDCVRCCRLLCLVDRTPDCMSPWNLSWLFVAMPTLLSWGCWNRLLATTTTTTEKNIKHTHKITKNEKKQNIFLILSFFFHFHVHIFFYYKKKPSHLDVVLRVWLLLPAPYAKKPTPKNPLKRS